VQANRSPLKFQSPHDWQSASATHGVAEQAEELEANGFAIVENVMTPAEQARFRSELGAADCAGRRGILAIPTVQDLARSRTMLNLVRPHLPTDPFPVRGIYFDKSPGQIGWSPGIRI
jgi:hypothetical protein